MLLSVIFLVSFSTLAFEVLLTRVFSIGQWNHLSFMVISIALFGFGASGTFLSMIDARSPRCRTLLVSEPSLAVLACLYTVAAMLSFLVLNNLPLDYFRLPVEPVQSLYLLTAFLLLSLPFFIAGTIIALGYTAQPEKTGLIYFASMAGSALGAIAPTLLLPLLSEGRLLVVMPLIPLLPVVSNALMPSFGKNSNAKHPYFWRTAAMGCGFGILCFAVILLSQSVEPIIRVKPSPFKSLSQVLQFPKTRIVDTKTSIRGRIEQVKTPYIRFAPGLSLKYTETIPEQDALFTDGDNQLVLYHLNQKKRLSICNCNAFFCGLLFVTTARKGVIVECRGRFGRCLCHRRRC